jgi:hypothetical protein
MGTLFSFCMRVGFARCKRSTRRLQLFSVYLANSKCYLVYGAFCHRLRTGAVPAHSAGQIRCPRHEAESSLPCFDRHGRIRQSVLKGIAASF